MGDGAFGPGDVLNRRVSSHITDLLPANIVTRSDYYIEGKRYLHPDHIPGAAKAGVCSLEAYVGNDGTFEVQVTRAFDPETDHGWRCRNRVRRTRAAGGRSLDPFEYLVRTVVKIGGKTRTDRSVVDWETLRGDEIYGGRDAQAAVLLCEQVAHRVAKSDEGFTSHHGSLSGRGSLSRVVDESRAIDVGWERMDDLLGPEADTIVATVGVEPIASEERVERAKERGIDFLSEGLVTDLEDTDFAEGDHRSVSDASPAAHATERSWESLPGDVDPDEAAAKLAEMRETIQGMRSRDED